MGVERCGRYREGGNGGGEGVLRGEGGVDVASSGDSGGVPMVDMGDVGAEGEKGVFGSLSV